MSESEKKKVRILLVDDEQDLVDFLTQRLRKRSYEVEPVTSGQDAVAAAEERIFDVAIVDLKMPQMNGIAVIKELRRHQPFLEAIMLTGHGSTESALEAGRMQAFRYLLKPYDFDKLVAEIEAAAASRRQRLRATFEERLSELNQSNATPREIKNASERLRREYEQD
jgi:DNA-binding NtrC family response regulator